MKLFSEGDKNKYLMEKKTAAYRAYVKAVPKDKRVPGRDTFTPNKHIKLSRRQWDKQISNWRKCLHQEWNPESEAAAEVNRNRTLIIPPKINMGLLYCAASYFIEAIYASETHNISYDYVQNLLSLVSTEIASFLLAYDENDYLYIFKKFPDVFLLKENSVSLTAAFMIFYQHKYSLTCKQNVKSDYIETSALLYFDNILKCRGPQHFLDLYNLLANDNSQHFADPFRNCSVNDASNFFKLHSDIFVLNDNMVYSNADTSIVMNPLLNEKVFPKIIKSVKEAVYFLLIHFPLLHYLDLKQCICYVLINAGEVFDQYPLIKQREWFENLPHTEMNEFGCLCLKTSACNLSFPPDSLKTILLIVCSLAFKKQMHYQKIVKELKQMFPPSIDYIQSMSPQHLLPFFLQNNQYFHVSAAEIVSLSPSFFPTGYPLGRPTFDSATQCTSSELKPFPFVKTENLNYDTSVPLSRSVDIDSQNDSCLMVGNNASSSQNDFLSLNSSSEDFFCMVKLSETTIKRIKISLSYLWQCVQTLKSEFFMQEWDFFQRAVKSVVHVLNDAYINLISLPEEDVHDFVTACCKFMALASDKREKYLSNIMLEEIKHEKVLLIITHCIKKKGTHFRKIDEVLKYNGINNSYLFFTTPEQFVAYFKNIPHFIRFDAKGILRLKTLPLPLKLAIGSKINLLQKRGIASLVRVDDISNSILQNYTPAVNSDSMNLDLGSQNDNTINKTSNGTLQKDTLAVNSNSKDLFSMLKFPESTIKRIKISLSYLWNRVQHLDFRCRRCACKKCYSFHKHAIITIMFVLNDVYKPLTRLSEEDHHIFIKACYQFMVVELYKNLDYMSPDMVEEIQQKTFLLVITYCISNRKTVHFKNCINILKHYGIDNPFLHLATLPQFVAYFEKLPLPFFIKMNPRTGYLFLVELPNSLRSVLESHFDLEQKIEKPTVLYPNCFHVQGKIPEIVYKILHCSIHFFRKCIGNVVAEQALAATVISLVNLCEYFCSFSNADISKFVEECLQFIQTEIDSFDACSTKILTVFGKKKENVLFTVYTLSEKSSLHYMTILKRLGECGIVKLKPRRFHILFQKLKMNSKYFRINRENILTLQQPMQCVRDAIFSAKNSLMHVKREDGPVTCPSKRCNDVLSNLPPLKKQRGWYKPFGKCFAHVPVTKSVSSDFPITEPTSDSNRPSTPDISERNKLVSSNVKIENDSNNTDKTNISNLIDSFLRDIRHASSTSNTNDST